MFEEVDFIDAEKWNKVRKYVVELRNNIDCEMNYRIKHVETQEDDWAFRSMTDREDCDASIDKLTDKVLFLCCEAKTSHVTISAKLLKCE